MVKAFLSLVSFTSEQSLCFVFTGALAHLENQLMMEDIQSAATIRQSSVMASITHTIHTTCLRMNFKGSHLLLCTLSDSPHGSKWESRKETFRQEFKMLRTDGGADLFIYLIINNNEIRTTGSALVSVFTQTLWRLVVFHPSLCLLLPSFPVLWLIYTPLSSLLHPQEDEVSGWRSNWDRPLLHSSGTSEGTPADLWP